MGVQVQPRKFRRDGA
ncbi:unnamed protein product [Linum tenue]|uniref:Uncharacterized protein n=1 Tax=Linum tenue TaxID=586396 RepID=A0AAV0NYS2_9ROSI|nr:unnamed protein product [Linum tenue]